MKETAIRRICAIAGMIVLQLKNKFDVKEKRICALIRQILYLKCRKEMRRGRLLGRVWFVFCRVVSCLV